MAPVPVYLCLIYLPPLRVVPLSAEANFLLSYYISKKRLKYPNKKQYVIYREKFALGHGADPGGGPWLDALSGAPPRPAPGPREE